MRKIVNQGIRWNLRVIYHNTKHNFCISIYDYDGSLCNFNKDISIEKYIPLNKNYSTFTNEGWIIL